MDTIKFEVLENNNELPQVDILINGKSLAYIFNYLEEDVVRRKYVLSSDIFLNSQEFKDEYEFGYLGGYELDTGYWRSYAYTCHKKEQTVLMYDADLGLFDFEFDREQYENAIEEAKNQYVSMIERIENETEGSEKLYEDKQFDVFHIKTKKGSIPFWNNTFLIEEMLTYHIQEKIYIIVNKQNDEMYLFHFESNTFVDKDNNKISESVCDTFEDSRGLIEFFIKELNEKPESDMKQSCLGAYHSAISNFSEAISHYEKAIKYDFEDYVAYHDMGMAYYNLEDYRNANVCYQKALEINPNMPGIHSKLGITYGMIGEYEKATESFKKAIEIDPDDNYSKENLASTYNMIADRGRGEKVEIQIL